MSQAKRVGGWVQKSDGVSRWSRVDRQYRHCRGRDHFINVYVCCQIDCLGTSVEGKRSARRVGDNLACLTTR